MPDIPTAASSANHAEAASGVESLLRSLSGNCSPRGVTESLARVSVPAQCLQDFRPLAESLEWELASLYWERAGVRPFVSNEVPFIVNNSGRASEDAAAVTFAACDEKDTEGGPIALLELGAGTGLFARFFLDTFKAICQQEGRLDYYERLVYCVSDQSEQTVRDWMDRDLFRDHSKQVVLGVCSADNPASFRPLAGTAVPKAPWHGVFCNYVLDILPTTILRQGERGVEQLCVRTHFTHHPDIVRQYTSMTYDQIRACAASGEPAEKAKLIPLLSLLELEAAFLPLGGPTPSWCAEALDLAGERGRAVLNHGALTSLHRCLERLKPNGFLLINDYGSTGSEEGIAQPAAQRFGATTAVGLNFPLLQRVLQASGYRVLVPDGDANHAIHSRLVMGGDLPRVRETFVNRYSTAAREFFHGPVSEGRRHLAAGRHDEALRCFQQALERSPRDWFLIGEIAEFVGLHLQNFASGAELALAALELNANYSPWLWNILGDCLFCEQRYNDADAAYRQAYRLDPQDVRTNFNLAYSATQLGEYEDGLSAIARALARDFQGGYRERLLEKQMQIVTLVAGRWVGEQERQAKRLEVLS